MASLKDRKDLVEKILHKFNSLAFDKYSEFDSEWSVHMLWMKEIMTETMKTFGSNTLGLPSSTPSSKKARLEHTIHVTGGTPFSFFKNFEVPSTPSTPFQPTSNHRYHTRSVAQTPTTSNSTPFSKPNLPERKPLAQPKLSISSISTDDSDSGQKKRRRAVNESTGTRKSARLKEKDQKLSIPCVVEMALKQKAQEDEEARIREEEETRIALERAEKIRKDKEERDKAKLLKEQAEKERLEKERQEKLRLEQERLEKERALQEEAARKKAEETAQKKAEELAQKKAEEERLRKEQEKLEQERKEREVEEQRKKKQLEEEEKLWLEEQIRIEEERIEKARLSRLEKERLEREQKEREEEAARLQQLEEQEEELFAEYVPDQPPATFYNELKEKLKKRKQVAGPAEAEPEEGEIQASPPKRQLLSDPRKDRPKPVGRPRTKPQRVKVETSSQVQEEKPAVEQESQIEELREEEMEEIPLTDSQELKRLSNGSASSTSSSSSSSSTTSSTSTKDKAKEAKPVEPKKERVKTLALELEKRQKRAEENRKLLQQQHKEKMEKKLAKYDKQVSQKTTTKENVAEDKENSAPVSAKPTAAPATSALPSLLVSNATASASAVQKQKQELEQQLEQYKATMQRMQAERQKREEERKKQDEEAKKQQFLKEFEQKKNQTSDNNTTKAAPATSTTPTTAAQSATSAPAPAAQPAPASATVAPTATKAAPASAFGNLMSFISNMMAPAETSSPSTSTPTSIPSTSTTPTLPSSKDNIPPASVPAKEVVLPVSSKENVPPSSQPNTNANPSLLSPWLAQALAHSNVPDPRVAPLVSSLTHTKPVAVNANPADKQLMPPPTFSPRVNRALGVGGPTKGSPLKPRLNGPAIVDTLRRFVLDIQRLNNMVHNYNALTKDYISRLQSIMSPEDFNNFRIRMQRIGWKWELLQFEAEPSKDSFVRTLLELVNDFTVGVTSEPESSYDMSDHKSSSEDEDSDDDSDDDTRHGKKIPSWASGPKLEVALMMQQHADPDKIFPQVYSCNLEDIFESFEANSTRKRQYKRKLEKRNSSANWIHDGITIQEMTNYKKQMGFH